MPALAAAGGATTDRISIARGTIITVPIRAIHLSEDIWGPDAKMFRPERWLSGDEPVAARARELSGHRHLLTFFDGPRICIGKNFALAEIKVRTRGCRLAGSVCAERALLGSFLSFFPFADFRQCCLCWCAISRSSSVTDPRRKSRRRWRSCRVQQSKGRRERSFRCVSGG